jgi:hypothetical protein
VRIFRQTKADVAHSWVRFLAAGALPISWPSILRVLKGFDVTGPPSIRPIPYNSFFLVVLRQIVRSPFSNRLRAVPAKHAYVAMDKDDDKSVRPRNLQYDSSIEIGRQTWLLTKPIYEASLRVQH